MSAAPREKIVTKVLFWALLCVTVGLATGGVTDPVNAPKFLLLGAFSFAVLGAIGLNQLREIFSANKITCCLLLLFLVASLISLTFSAAPFTQSLYGNYGRNNGFLSYLFLGILLFGTLLLRSKSSFELLIKALYISGILNVIYGIWVMIFGDFIGWSNPYGNLLGTLGNPNFAGSFFGIFSIVPITYLLKQGIPIRTKVINFCLLALTFICILETHAVQGKVLFLFAVGAAIFFVIRDRFNSLAVAIAYLVSGFLISLASLLGALQIGPLTKYVYKESVSLRGEYWYAGLKTALSNPVHGVGFDSYGDWYRMSRRASSLVRPGVDTVSNTAHNVVIDIFASGGFLLVIPYLLLTFLVLLRIIKHVKENRKFDSVFIVLTVAWLCYQLQSIISINQIGLAIWGWVLGGLIISYTSLGEQNEVIKIAKRENKVNVVNQVFTPLFGATVMFGVGALIAVPPVTADVKWQTAQVSRNAEILQLSLDSNYFNPQNSFKINSIVGVFATNGLELMAYEAALQAVAFNPHNFESWRNLYILNQTSDQEKLLAVSKIRKLDPLNPTFKAGQ